MADETEAVELTDEVRYLDGDSVIEMRDESKRELDIRIVPWDTVITHQFGPEMFERGAFADVDPKTVMLRAPVATDGKHGPLVGRCTAIQERNDAAYGTFRVSKIQAGDELLTLVADGVISGASLGFVEKPGGTSIQHRNGQRVRVQSRVNLDHVAVTWKPAYPSAGVIAMRSEHEGEPMAEATPTPAIEAAPAFPVDQLTAVLTAMQERSTEGGQLSERLMDRIEKLEERSRSEFSIPTGPAPDKRKPTIYHWASYALRTMLGQQVAKAELQERALDDIITSDNPGLVPDALVNDLLGRIQARRPFMQSTTQIAAPDSGMAIVVPVIQQHSTADVQGSEKTDIESTALKVTTASFDAVSVFGGADVSIQMIRRAEASFMDLLMQDLGQAYAAKADSEAISALFAAGTTPGSANFDPENLVIGEAWKNSIQATGLPPDKIWLSSDGVAAFIDAKSDGSNAPLYFTLRGNFGAGNGTGGDVSALQPVYVPALDGTSVDVLIGPSSGFAWAEDGNIQLSVDNPTKAGRDIALGGILFFIPRYAAAFTSYDLGS